MIKSKLKNIVIIVFSISCSLLALLWSQWRNELWAEYYCYLPFSYNLTDYGISGKAKLGPKNSLRIKGKMKFLERADGSLSIEGEAIRMDHEKLYVSLFYDIGSRPNGPNACLPSLGGNELIIGFWEVDADGNGVLSRDISKAKLTDWRTVSIRLYNFETNEPGLLQACGKIRIRH